MHKSTKTKFDLWHLKGSEASQGKVMMFQATAGKHENLKEGLAVRAVENAEKKSRTNEVIFPLPRI